MSTTLQLIVHLQLFTMDQAMIIILSKRASKKSLKESLVV